MRRAIPYYYPGKFSPPNKYDLSVVNWLSRKIYDVSNVIVVIGNYPNDPISIDQKADIWDEFLKSNTSGDIKVIKDYSNSPLAAIYKLQERSREDAFGIALAENVAANKDFKDTFSYFPSYEIILTPNYDQEIPAKVSVAIEQEDFKTFSSYMPDNLSVEEKHKIFKQLKPVQEPASPMLFESYWREVAKSMIKSVK